MFLQFFLYMVRSTLLIFFHRANDACQPIQHVSMGWLSYPRMISININRMIISIMNKFSIVFKFPQSWYELYLFSRSGVLGISWPSIWVNMGWKNGFFYKSLKIVFLSSLTISDGSGVQIWYLKMVSDLKKIRFLTFLKIEILSPNPSEMMTLRLQILNFLCWCFYY